MPQFNKQFVITQIINVLREKLESRDIKLGKDCLTLTLAGGTLLILANLCEIQF